MACTFVMAGSPTDIPPLESVSLEAVTSDPDSRIEESQAAEQPSTGKTEDLESQAAEQPSSGQTEDLESQAAEQPIYENTPLRHVRASYTEHMDNVPTEPKE